MQSPASTPSTELALQSPTELQLQLTPTKKDRARSVANAHPRRKSIFQRATSLFGFHGLTLDVPNPEAVSPAVKAAAGHFLDRCMEQRHDRGSLHPLSPWRIAWRRMLTILLLAWTCSLTCTSWQRYRCDADPWCDPRGRTCDGASCACEEWESLLGRAVRVSSFGEAVVVAAMPQPGHVGGHSFWVEASTARVLWRAGRWALPLDLILSVPWFELDIVTLLTSWAGHVPNDVCALWLFRRLRLCAPTQAGTKEEAEPRWPLVRLGMLVRGRRAVVDFLSSAAHQSKLGRSVVGYIRARRFTGGFQPPPRILQPLVEEFVMPVLFGRGRQAVYNLVVALPAIGDVRSRLRS